MSHKTVMISHEALKQGHCPLRPVYHRRVQGDTQRKRGCGGVSVNASALDWYIREAVFSHLVPEQAADLLMDDESSDDKMKQFLDQRAARQLRLDSLVGLCMWPFGPRRVCQAKSRVTAELSRINGEVEI